MYKRFLPCLALAMLIWIASAGWTAVSYADGDACQIEGTGYATLQDALTAVGAGQTKTIILLQDITYNHSISVDSNKDLTIDLNGYDLAINADIDHGLKAISGSLTISDEVVGGGKLMVTSAVDQKAAVYSGAGGFIDITGDATATGGAINAIGVWANDGTIHITGDVEGCHVGVQADNGGLLYITGTVTGDIYGAFASNGTINITGSAIAGSLQAVQADTNSTVNITGNATGGTDSSSGVAAVSNSTIHIGGDVSGSFEAAAAESGSTVTIEGNASVTLNNGFVVRANSSTIIVRGNVVTTGNGPTVNNGGEITIDGTVTATPNRYAYVNGVGKTILNYEAVTTKAQYRTYYNAGGGGVNPSTVWVKLPSAAEIEGTGYATLQDALAAVGAGQTKTIKLLQDLTYNHSISVDSNKDLTIDLNGYDLAINADIDHGLKAVNGSLTISDADGDGSLTVSAALDQKAAVYTGAGGTINITGSAVATGGNFSQGVFGAFANGGTIRISGDVTGYNAGAYTANGTIEITGDVTGTIYGVYAPSNGTVEVDGNVTALYWKGAYAQSNSIINVTGDLTGGINGDEGASAYDSTITVGGNVTGTDEAVYSGGTGSVTVDGNAFVTGNGGYALLAIGSPITVKGNVTTTGPGPAAYDGGQITIDGVVSAAANRYLHINGVEKSSVDYEAVTTKGGYRTFYAAGDVGAGTTSASVWVKIPTNPGTVSFVAGGIGTYEGNHTELTGIGLERTGGSAGAASVDYAFNNGSAVSGTHYLAASGTVNWADGEDGIKYIPYTIYEDGTYNGYLDFYVTLTDPVGGITISGSNPIQIEISDNETPPVPTGLTAAAGNGSVALSWNSVNDAYYTISYSVNPDAVTGGSTTGVWNATSKTITGLSNGTTYYFAVKSGHNIYFSNFSAVVSAAPKASSGSGGGGKEPTVPPVYQIAAAGNTTTGMEVIPNTNGNVLTANATEEIFDAILEKALAKDAADGQDDIEIKIAGQKVSDTEVTIPRQSLQQVADKTDAGMKITAPIASVRFDDKAIDAICDASESSDTIRISVGIIDTKKLSTEDQEKLAGRPVYDFSVTAGSGLISDFKGGYATVVVPYTLKVGENPDAVVVYYLGDDGTLKTVRGSYSAETGTVVFKTGHFSNFVIGYNPIEFNDVVKGAWYEKAAVFTAARGIVTGLDEATFGPGQKLTRAQFITMFLRAYGIVPEQGQGLSGKDNFSDAGDTWYTNYILAAKTMGITKGIGSNLFAPDREITRQEMFTMLYNGLKIMGELEDKSNSETGLNAFDDSAQIAKWSKEAAAALVGKGIVSGSNNKLSPTAYTTRGEMAQVLYKLLSD